MPLFGTQPDTYPRHQGDEYKYYLENDILQKDAIAGVELAPGFTFTAFGNGPKLILLPTGMCAFYAEGTIKTAVTKGDPLFKLPLKPHFQTNCSIIVDTSPDYSIVPAVLNEDGIIYVSAAIAANKTIGTNVYFIPKG
jgi:hypothetical protein